MKKLLLLAFGLLIAASAAYCVPKEFKEFKVKPVIEKVFTMDQVAPAVIVDQINLNMEAISNSWCNLNYDNAIMEEKNIRVPIQSEYRWHRIQTSVLNKANSEKTFTPTVNRIYKRPDKK